MSKKPYLDVLIESITLSSNQPEKLDESATWNSRASWEHAYTIIQGIADDLIYEATRRCPSAFTFNKERRLLSHICHEEAYKAVLPKVIDTLKKDIRLCKQTDNPEQCQREVRIDVMDYEDTLKELPRKIERYKHRLRLHREYLKAKAEKKAQKQKNKKLRGK